jgi:Lrp/AsnC family transcriptional regulator for asnA, asnC and gidA
MIDEKDREILFELLQDCRQSISKIAKSVGLPKQTVSYRITKLEKEKIIKKYTINIDYQKLGFNRHSLYLNLEGIQPEKVDEYLKTITSINEVSCCYMLHNISRWKIYVSVWAKTIGRYDEIQTKIISRFKEHIKNYLSFQGVRSYTYFARRLNLTKKAKVDIKEEMDDIKLKEIEEKIIKELRKNSKISVVDLAYKFNTTTKNVALRIKDLKNKGIIQRFYPIIDMKKIGYTEYTFISRVDPSYEKNIDQFIEYIKQDPRFVIVIKAVGYVNIYYAFLTENSEELDEIIGNIEKILGKGLLETHKIEVRDMIS